MKPSNPEPIPPELPTDPAQVPPPSVPINSPPEKGPGAPEPLPPSPIGPERYARAAVAVAFLLLLSGAPAFAQHSAGKDTSELTPANPIQQCSRFTDPSERARCMDENRAPGDKSHLRNRRGNEQRQVLPSVGHEVRPAEPHSGAPVDPNRPAATSR